MAYETIDVHKMKSALNACKGSINHSITTDFSNSIMNSNIWMNNSKNKLSKAFGELDNLYKELEKEIEEYLGVADMIQRYKVYAMNNDNLNRENSDLRGRQYYNELCSEEYKDINGLTQTRSWYERRENTSVTSQINSNNSKIAQNNREMENIKNKINIAL